MEAKKHTKLDFEIYFRTCTQMLTRTHFGIMKHGTHFEFRIFYIVAGGNNVRERI